MKAQKIDFTGSHIYVGIDVHLKSWNVSIFTQEFEHCTKSFVPETLQLVKYLRRTFPNGIYHCVYEAGFSGFWLYWELKSHGIDCMVVSPADVPTNDKERHYKTDKIDSRKLCRMLRSREIKGIYVPEREDLEDRLLVRLRGLLVKDLVRCKNRIKGLLHYYGIKIEDQKASSYWSKVFISWLENIQMNNISGKRALMIMIDELKYIRTRVTELTKEIRTLATTSKYCERVENLTSIPGISTLSAMIIICELINIERFKTVDELLCYIGLIPMEHSSGEKEWKGQMSKRGNRSLKQILIECSWVAVKKDPSLLLAYKELTKRMKGVNAITRITRKLIRRIRYVLTTNTRYRICAA